MDAQRAKKELARSTNKSGQRDVVTEMMSCLESDTVDYHSSSKIANFYAGRSVFITGASGFIGKTVVEKLLRSCPDVANIYILLRPKRDKSVDERLKELTESEIFSRLRSNGNATKQLSKIKAIAGDITETQFGISESDRHILATQVSIVLHSAATVKFNEPMKQAVQNNLASLKNLIDLLVEFKSLQALVHVSTAYANCDREYLDELFYDPPMDPYKLLDMAQWMDDELMDSIKPTLLGKRPNTYTYTKSVAEALLADQVKGRLNQLPTAIVRPSIVAGAWREPTRGWVDNFNGPTGVSLSMSTGCLQAVYGYPNYNADIIPVDIVSNCLISAAWYLLCERHHSVDVETLAPATGAGGDHHVLASQYDHADCQKQILRQNNIEIFHCVTSSRNPLTWGQFAQTVYDSAKRYPCHQALRLPSGLILNNTYVHKAYDFVNHYCVSQVLDFGARLIGRKPRMMIIYNRMKRMMDMLTPFTVNQWLFRSDNVVNLHSYLDPIDRQIFNLDISQLDWSTYLRDYYIGARTFTLKEDPKQLPQALKALKRRQTSSLVSAIVMMLVTYYILLNGSVAEDTLVNLSSAAVDQLRSMLSA